MMGDGSAFGTFRPHYKGYDGEYESDEEDSHGTYARHPSLRGQQDLRQRDIGNCQDRDERDEHVERPIQADSSRQFLSSLLFVIGLAVFAVIVSILISSATILAIIGLLGAFFQWLYSQYLLDSGPIQEVRRP